MVYTSVCPGWWSNCESTGIRQWLSSATRRGLTGQRLPVAVAGSQGRIIRQHRLDSHHHGVGFPPHLLHEGAGFGAGDPLGVSGAGGNLAVETHGELGQHEGQSGGYVLGESLV